MTEQDQNWIKEQCALISQWEKEYGKLLGQRGVLISQMDKFEDKIIAGKALVEAYKIKHQTRPHE